jgi:hypothetical protein
MTLHTKKFIRRFSLHILPKRFVKIRHGFGVALGSVKAKAFTRETSVKVLEK